jgi:hypothetical protein
MENKFGGITTMTTLKFIWIDDDNARLPFKRSLEAYRYKDGKNTLKAKVEFLSVQGQDTIETIVKHKKLLHEMDLVLIDHILNHTIGPSRKGTTVAEVIREIIPKCPIVGITAVGNKKYIDQNVLYIYEDLFYISDVSDSRSSIFTIASTFKELNKKRLKSLRAKVNLFLPPDDDDAQILEKILPTASKKLNIEESSFRLVANWALHVLILKPGMLYDQQWATNLIGIKENSFCKVEKMFVGAKYKGIFCNKENPRWWKSKLKELIFINTKNKNTNKPWEAGHFLPGISKTDYSICYSCKEYFPETLGYLDDSEKSRLVPLHYQHSKPHPAYRNDLFFDEIRLMKDTKK